MKKNKIKYVLANLPTSLLLWFYMLVVILPMVWLFIGSIKTSSELYGSPWSLPSSSQWNNYVVAWTEAELGRAFLNSIYVTLLSLIATILLAAMASYVLARFSFLGNRFFYYLFTAGMIFPLFLGLVPLFFLLNDLKLLNSLNGLVLTYTAFSLPFTVFVLTGYFKTLPRELEEAAELDGCSVFRTFWSIMFPMAKPGLVAVAIFNVIGMWNQYLLALISITDPQKRTLPLGIANLLMIQQYRTNWGALLAGLMITILPLLILYILFHSHITRGMTAGALKG